LAGRWFAPHYAVPESWSCVSATALLTAPSATAVGIGQLAPGEQFAVLEISGDYAWGYREQDSRVGYVAAGALSQGPM